MDDPRARSVDEREAVIVIVVACLVVAFRRSRDSSHGSRSRDSAVPIPARRGSTYPLAIARKLQQTKQTRMFRYTFLCFAFSRFYISSERPHSIRFIFSEFPLVKFHSKGRVSSRVRTNSSGVSLVPGENLPSNRVI